MADETTLYDKKTHEAVKFRYSVDAREALASGNFELKGKDVVVGTGPDSQPPYFYPVAPDSHVPPPLGLEAPEFKSAEQLRTADQKVETPPKDRPIPVVRETSK